MLCQVINSWQIAIYSYSEEFSNEDLCGVLECLQLPVLDRPGIAYFRDAARRVLWCPFLTAWSVRCQEGWAHLSFLWVLCPVHPGRLEEEQWYRQTDRLKSGGEAHLLGCRVKKGTSWSWWLGRNAGEGRMLRRYWILKSGARGCVCGRCLLVLLGRYIFFRRENLYSFQKFMSLLDVSLKSNIWMILYCCFCYFLFLFSYRWSISIPEGTAAKFFYYCFYHWHIHDFYDSQNNIFLVLVPFGSMRLRSYISYLVYN